MSSAPGRVGGGGLRGAPVPPDSEDGAAEAIARVDARATRHDIIHDGCRVAWRCFGAGRPLVLVHGGHGSWMHWIRNVEALAEHRLVCVPDLPGYGDSEAPARTDLSGVLDPLRGSLDALVGAESSVDVVGFSFGGLVAAHLAASRPGVRGLALLGSAGHGGARRPRGEQQSWRRQFQAGDRSGLCAVMRHNLGVHMLHAPASVDALALRVHLDSCLRTRFRSKGISRGGGLAAALDRHWGPLLLAWGEHDVTAEPQAAAGALAAGREACRTQIVPDAGHWVQYEQAARVNRLLLDWLGEDTQET